MSSNGMEELHSFLNSEGRELANIKFLPGTSRDITKEKMTKEARASLGRVFASGLKHEPPCVGEGN